MARRALFFAAALLAALPAGAGELPDDEPERFEGLTVERFEIIAPPREDRSALAELAGLEAGRAFRAEDIRAAVRVLFRTGRFDEVIVSGRREANSVVVRIRLEPRLWVRELRIEGDAAVDSGAIEQALGVAVGEPLQLSSFARRRSQIERLLARHGHRSAAVGIGAQRRDSNGGLELVVRIDAGPLVRLRELVVKGRPRLSKRRLEDALGLSKGEVIDLERTERAAAQLLLDYRRRGFFDARVGDLETSGSTDDASAPSADLVIPIDAGPLVRVIITGNEVIRKKDLLESARLFEQIGAGPDAVNEVDDAIVTRYQRLGFWRARVETRVRTSADARAKEVSFSISEGYPVRVGSFRFPGRPDIPELPESLLVEKIEQVISQGLGPDDVRAQSDQTAISELTGDRPARKLEPTTTVLEPEPSRIYLKKSYAEATQAIADLYRDRGFLAAEVGPHRVTERIRPDAGSELDVEIPIRPGVRWLLGSVSFRGNDVVDALDLFSLAAKVDIGATLGASPLSFYRVEEARRAIESHYRDLGHLFVKVEQHYREVTQRGAIASTRFAESPSRALSEICLDALRSARQACEVELVFRIQEGDRAIVHKIRPPIGAMTTRESLIRSELTLIEGDVISAAELLKSERNLLRLGVFSKVAVRPLDPETEETQKDLVIEVSEKKPVAVEVGAGLSTEEGFRVFAGLTHANVLGRAIRAQANARANVPFLFFYSDAIRSRIEALFAERPVEYSLSLGFDYPHVLGLPRGFGVGVDLSVLQQTDLAFREDGRAVTLGLSYNGLRPSLLGRPRPIGLQLRLGFEWSDLVCNSFEGESTPEDSYCGGDRERVNSGTAVYASVRPSFSFDLRDDAFNPRFGLYLEARPDVYFGFNEESPDLLDLRAKLNLYLPFPFGTTLAVSLIGWRVVPFPSEAAIPVNHRYFAGGRSTIRGYQEQTLFPADIESVVAELSPGGLLFFALKSEIRVPFSDAFSIAPFVDAGDLYADPSKVEISDATRRAFGVGLRYMTPIGPLLLDFGFPFAPRRASEVAWTVHFAAVGSF
ncbi:MAG: BamA/TamA family outer membrane protein [Deltaproteobacteria bacterium]|nr:BamA/TamA family outer membrane protein [Deltaproteobacteria bacterium]